MVMCCEVRVDGKIVGKEAWLSPLNKYLPKQAYAKLENIFAFDVSKFKSFERA